MKKNIEYLMLIVVTAVVTLLCTSMYGVAATLVCVGWSILVTWLVVTGINMIFE